MQEVEQIKEKSQEEKDAEITFSNIFDNETTNLQEGSTTANSSGQNSTSTTDSQTIKVFRLRLYYIRSNTKKCEHCEAFLKSKTYEDLALNYRKIFGDFEEVIYEEMPCDWQGLYRYRYCDEDVREDASGIKLKFDLDYETQNFLIGLGILDNPNFPAIEISIMTRDGIIKEKTYQGIMAADSEEYEILLFDYIRDFLDKEGYEHSEEIKNRFKHEVIKKEVKADPLLNYEEKLTIDEDKIIKERLKEQQKIEAN